MNQRDRYQASGAQAEFEPGSRGRVLRNRLGITRVRDMNEAESQALLIAQDAALDRYRPGSSLHRQRCLCAPWAVAGADLRLGRAIPHGQHRQGVGASWKLTHLPVEN